MHSLCLKRLLQFTHVKQQVTLPKEYPTHMDLPDEVDVYPTPN